MAKPSDMRQKLQVLDKQDREAWEFYHAPAASPPKGGEEPLPDLAQTSDDLMEALELLREAKENFEDILALDKRDRLFTATRRDTIMEMAHSIGEFRDQWEWEEDIEGEGGEGKERKDGGSSYTYLSCGHRAPLGTQNCAFCLATMIKEAQKKGEERKGKVGKGNRLPVCLACGDTMARTFTGIHLCPTCGSFDEFEDREERGAVCLLTPEDERQLADPYYEHPWD